MRRSLCLLVFVLSACAAPETSPEVESLGAAASSERQACEPRAADWGWSKLGVVRGLPEPAAAGDGALAPAVLEHEGVLHLWYSWKVGVRYALLHATSTDGGETFAAPVRVTGLGDRLNAYPSVWREDGAFKMLFGSGSIQLATSADGVDFTLAPSSVLSASFDAGRFDALSVAYPSLALDDEGTGPALYFSGYDGQRLRVGRAVPRADGTFEVDPPRPVVDVGAPDDFDNAAVAQAHVRRAFGRWWMWYGGYDTSQTNPGPYRVGVASSPDGIAWTKHGVVVPLSPTGTDAWSTRDPAVARLGSGRWLMVYVGLGDDGRYRLHRASSECSRDSDG